MVERQPNRPTVEEFTGAALRIIEDNYPIEAVHVACGMYVNIHHAKLGHSSDIDIVRREAVADGLPGIRESIRDFATRQLAWYQKSKKS